MYRFTFAFGIVALMFTPALRAEIGIDPQAPDDPSYFVSDNIRYHHILSVYPREQGKFCKINFHNILN